MESGLPERAERARRFRAAIDATSARSAKALRLRFVTGASREECAAFFGISPAAFDVMLVRAGRELDAKLHATPTHRPPSDAAEHDDAQRLADSFEHQRKLLGELDALRSMLDQLASLSSEIRAQDAQAALEEESSTRRRRRELLWRALLLAIVGAALFLYFRPRPPPRVLSRVPAEELR